MYGRRGGGWGRGGGYGRGGWGGRRGLGFGGGYGRGWGGGWGGWRIRPGFGWGWRRPYYGGGCCGLFVLLFGLIFTSALIFGASRLFV